MIWGLLHGIYLVVEIEFYKKFPSIQKSQNMLVLFIRRSAVFVLVVIAWVFFRAATLSDALHIVGNFLVGLPHQINSLLSNVPFARLELLYLGQPGIEFVLAIVFIAVLMMVHTFQQSKSFDDWVLQKPAYARWSIYYSLILLFFSLGIFNRSEFIYFQF